MEQAELFKECLNFIVANNEQQIRERITSQSGRLYTLFPVEWNRLQQLSGVVLRFFRKEDVANDIVCECIEMIAREYNALLLNHKIGPFVFSLLHLLPIIIGLIGILDSKTKTIVYIAHSHLFF